MLFFMKRTKRVLAFSLALITLMSASVLANGVVSVSNFTDVKSSDWFYTSVKYAVDHGMVSGTSATTFSPQGTMTRGQFLTILGRMDGYDASKEASVSISDVPGSQYYAEHSKWAVNQKLVALASGKLYPDRNITREEMAVIMYNYINYKGAKLSDEKNAVTKFNDIGTVSASAKDAVEYLRKVGMMAGDNKGNFNPSQSMTRAEGVTVFMRLSEKLTAAGIKLSDQTNQGGPGAGAAPAGKDWFKVTGDSFTIALDDRSVGIYSFLSPDAQGKLSNDDYIFGLDISDRSILNTKNGFFAPQKVGTVDAKWYCVTPQNETFYTSAKITIGENVTVYCESLTATIGNSSLAGGESSQITVAFNPANTTNKKVTYTSASPGIASVSSTGLVTGMAKGSTYIQVMAPDGCFCNVNVTVTSTPEIVVPGTPNSNYTVDSTYIQKFNDEVIRLVNIERANNGLVALKYSDSLQSGASIRAEELSVSFSHMRPDGSACGTAFEGIVPDVYGSIAECGYKSGTNDDCSDPIAVAKMAVDTWINSPAHKAILLKDVKNGDVACGITKAPSGGRAYASFDLYKK